MMTERYSRTSVNVNTVFIIALLKHDEYVTDT